MDHQGQSSDCVQRGCVGPTLIHLVSGKNSSPLRHFFTFANFLTLNRICFRCIATSCSSIWEPEFQRGCMGHLVSEKNDRRSISLFRCTKCALNFIPG